MRTSTVTVKCDLCPNSLTDVGGMAGDALPVEWSYLRYKVVLGNPDVRDVGVHEDVTLELCADCTVLVQSALNDFMKAITP